MKASNDLKSMTEVEILQRVQAGHAYAYGEIFSRHREKAFALAYQYVRNREDALDVVQDAFIRAFQRISRFDMNRKFGPWLLTIVRNLSIDCIRKRRRTSNEDIAGTPADRDVKNSAEREVLRGEVWRAMSQLSSQHREIIFLKDYQGHNYEEIAGILDIPLGTVMSRLHHARKNLIKLIHEVRRD